MFCKWCGKKLREITTVCPACQRTQGRMENANFLSGSGAGKEKKAPSGPKQAPEGGSSPVGS